MDKRKNSRNVPYSKKSHDNKTENQRYQRNKWSNIARCALSLINGEKFYQRIFENLNQVRNKNANERLKVCNIPRKT